MLIRTILVALTVLATATPVAGADVRFGTWTDPHPKQLAADDFPNVVSASVSFDRTAGTVDATLAFTGPIPVKYKDDGMWGASYEISIGTQYVDHSGGDWQYDVQGRVCNPYDGARQINLSFAVFVTEPSTARLVSVVLPNTVATFNAARDAMTLHAGDPSLIGLQAVCWTGRSFDDYTPLRSLPQLLFPGVTGIDGDVAGAIASAFKHEVAAGASNPTFPGHGRVGQIGERDLHPRCTPSSTTRRTCSVAGRTPYIVGRPNLRLRGYSLAREHRTGRLAKSLYFDPHYKGTLRWPTCPKFMNPKGVGHPCSLQINWTRGTLRQALRHSLALRRQR